ncbi:reverse transcriptase domain-containing protein [Tanacetum coccineum]
MRRLNIHNQTVWVERANTKSGEESKRACIEHKGSGWRSFTCLWAHRTTIKVSTGDTPFSLVYGTEAVIPAEIGMPTIRTAEVNITTNDDERRIDLDILEERREQAAIREEKAKLKMKGYYDAKVRGVLIRPEGLRVSCLMIRESPEGHRKLGPKWETRRGYEAPEKGHTTAATWMGAEFPASGRLNTQEMHL